jgi:DNA-binding CsgD family transcriptional regulator
MAKRRRRIFTAAESAEVWDRWQRGELKLIGRVFDRSSGAIFQHLKPHGGIRPVPRRRSSRVLSLDDREEISRGVASGVSLRSIATTLGRAASTISRELRRNGGHRGYRAAAADKRAWDRALRLKLCELARHEELRQLVAARLRSWKSRRTRWLAWPRTGDTAAPSGPPLRTLRRRPGGRS